MYGLDKKDEMRVYTLVVHDFNALLNGENVPPIGCRFAQKGKKAAAYIDAISMLLDAYDALKDKEEDEA